MTLLIPALLLLACTSDTTRPDDTTSTADSAATPIEVRNVIVVLVDTLRADHLQAWGYGRENSSAISAFAARSVRFEDAIAPDAWTVPVIGSLWTGLYPSAHGLKAFSSDTRIDDDEVLPVHKTLAELFHDAGFATAALVKSPVVRADRGHGQGFDSMETVEGRVDYDTSGQELTDAALDWLQQDGRRDQPFMLYLHYMEPHTHYIAPEPYYDAYDQGSGSALTGTHAEVKAFLDGTATATDGDKTRLHALYDGEIAYLDSQLSRLFDHLDSTGLANNSVVVLMGDHGEQFGEHGSWIHGDLYQENIHVPLVVRVPGLEPRVVSGTVQSFDITATLAGLFALGTVDSWHSRDLGDALTGGAVPQEPAYFEYANERGVVTAEGWKYFNDAGAPHLFNLDTDPLEQTDLIDVEVDVAEELRVITEALHDQSLVLREGLD